MPKPADTSAPASASASASATGPAAANGGAPSPSPRDLIHTRIWQEEPEPDNPFATRAAYCRGYDVFGELVGQARWVEMLLLLLRDERPAPAAVATLEALAVALANPARATPRCTPPCAAASAAPPPPPA